jgi:TIR domain
MPESKRPLKVFLCHASADKPKVRELYRYLRRRGIQPWLDAENLIPGQNWEIEIPKAIQTSDAIIICLTKNSIDKEGYVQKEIRFALDKALEMPEGRIFLIPARLEECDLPYSLKQYQWVNFYEEGGYSKLMKALKERALQLERATVELTIEQLSPVDSSQPDLTESNPIKELFFRIDKQITEKYFPYFFIICLGLSAIIGGFIWNIMNILLNWTFQLGGSGNEPHSFQAFIWGVVSFFPVLFFAGLASYRYILSKRESPGKLGIVIMLYVIFAGLGAVVFYDLGFRNYIEALGLGYGTQELVIVSIWAFVISLSISLPLLVFSRFTAILNARFIFAQIPLSVVLAFLAIIASLFIPKPENEIAQLRGFFAAVALRIGLFIGMYLSISRNSRKLM